MTAETPFGNIAGYIFAAYILCYYIILLYGQYNYNNLASQKLS